MDGLRFRNRESLFVSGEYLEEEEFSNVSYAKGGIVLEVLSFFIDSITRINDNII